MAFVEKMILKRINTIHLIILNKAISPDVNAAHYNRSEYATIARHSGLHGLRINIYPSWQMLQGHLSYKTSQPSTKYGQAEHHAENSETCLEGHAKQKGTQNRVKLPTSY